MEDLKSFITNKKSYLEKIKPSDFENMELIFKFLKICFKFPSKEFLIALNENIYDIIFSDLMGDDCAYFEYIDSYYYIFQDYDMDYYDTMNFVLSCLIPDVKILNYMIEKPYFDEDQKKEIKEFENFILNIFDDNKEVPEEIRKMHKKWLKEDMKEFTRSGEGFAFITLVFTSPYLYEMYSDPKLDDFFNRVFCNFNVYIDDKTKTVYIYYGLIGYDTYGDGIQQTFDFCDIDTIVKANNYIKRKFKLKHDRSPILHKILNKIKLAGNWSYSDKSGLISGVHQVLLTKKEVMF